MSVKMVLGCAVSVCTVCSVSLMGSLLCCVWCSRGAHGPAIFCFMRTVDPTADAQNRWLLPPVPPNLTEPLLPPHQGPLLGNDSQGWWGHHGNGSHGWWGPNGNQSQGWWGPHGNESCVWWGHHGNESWGWWGSHGNQSEGWLGPHGNQSRVWWGPHGNGTPPDVDLAQNSSLLVPVLYLAVCVAGLVGNALVIFVILRHARMMASATNVYILNLALADVLCMLSLPFVGTQLALLHWPFGAPLCRLVLALDSLNQFTSIFFLTVMSVDRYLAVVQHVRSARWRRPPVAKCVSACVWGASLLVNLPVLIFSGISRHGDNLSCNIQWPEPQERYNTAFIFYTLFLAFLIPLAIICLCYILIIAKVKSSGARVVSSRHVRSEQHVTRMVCVVVCVFVLCWLPFFVFNVASVTGSLRSTAMLKSTFDVVVVLGYANSCANPVLYAFLSHNFKKSFRNILCPRRPAVVQDVERSGGPHDRTHMINNVTIETHVNVQTSI
ncbi:hypothetical protein ACEWY4_003514 [Coilia grayii]|uniref:G-protein coupled receptors family 1 profile domain-containing protein n=1 Tax=Coilia grayii TaxID=363190 RepID=A0ABD1KRI1_9TELE